jgi:hypothetical protein
MNEVLSVLYGCGLGVFLGSFISSRRQRYFCWLGLSALLGLAATIGTGEWKIGWEFLLIDIPLVSACSFSVIALRRGIKNGRGEWVQPNRFGNKP